MSRPAVVAVVGPSASGKDSLARGLVSYLQRRRIWGHISDTSHLIVSDTTRPMRYGERDGFDYNFVSTDEFRKRDMDGEYIETYVYGPQRWRYGTPRWELNSGINVGVFSPSGLDGIKRCCSSGHEIVTVLLDAPPVVRLWRSVKRDGCLTREHLRRLRQDRKDFDGIAEAAGEGAVDLRGSKLSVDGLVQVVYNILCDRNIVHTI